jgi:hypothetical protein
MKLGQQPLRHSAADLGSVLIELLIIDLADAMEEIENARVAERDEKIDIYELLTTG